MDKNSKTHAVSSVELSEKEKLPVMRRMTQLIHLSRERINYKRKVRELLLNATFRNH